MLKSTEFAKEHMVSTALGRQTNAATTRAPALKGHQRSIYITCACIFLLSLVIRVGLLVATRSYAFREEEEVVHVAASLARGHGFANAYGNGAPTAHMSPLYPLLLSLVYRLFGIGVKGEIAQEVLSCILASLTWALLPLLAEICRLDRRVGLTSGLAGAVLVVNRWAETKGSFEAAMAGLACLLVFTLFMRCWYSRDFSLETAIVTGVVSGFAMLVSASLGSIVASLLVAGYFLFREALGWKYLRFGLMVVTLIVATSFPWALRNRLVLGGWVWTRSNFPLELLVSNNDDARPIFKDNAMSFYKYHPFASPQKRVMAKRVGELAFERETETEAKQWIRNHPKQFARLTLQRIYFFWFPVMKRELQTVLMALLFLASIPSLVSLVRRKQPLGFAVLAVWIAYPLVYYIIEEEARYPYLIQWSKYLLTAYSAHIVLRRLTAERIAA